MHVHVHVYAWPLILEKSDYSSIVLKASHSRIHLWPSLYTNASLFRVSYPTMHVYCQVYRATVLSVYRYAQCLSEVSHWHIHRCQLSRLWRDCTASDTTSCCPAVLLHCSVVPLFRGASQMCGSVLIARIAAWPFTHDVRISGAKHSYDGEIAVLSHIRPCIRPARKRRIYAIISLQYYIPVIAIA